MSREARLAPVDIEGETGMPLPILLTPIPPGNCSDTNRHHAFYNRSAFEQDGTEGSRAVRLSRVQTVPIYLHNRFHTAFRGGVPLPDDEHQEFRLTVLGYAGYVPDKAVNVGHGIDLGAEPKLVHINRTQRRELRQPGMFTVEEGKVRSRKIGDFLIGYAVKNGLDLQSNESLIEQFLYAKTFEKRWNVGMRLIENATEVAAEPMDLAYNSLKKRRLLGPQASRCPSRLVRNHVARKDVGFPSLLEKSLLKAIS